MKIKFELGLFLGLALSGVVYIACRDLEPEARAVTGAIVFMITLWVTNCIPVATSPFYLIGYLYLSGIKDPYLLFSGYTSFMTWLLLALMFISASIKETSLDTVFFGLLNNKHKESPLQLYRKLTTANMFISPVVTNNIARMLIIMPLYNSVSTLVNNKNYSKALYLSLLFTNTIISQMFLLSEIPLITVELIKTGTGIRISWLEWLKISWLPILGLIIFLQVTLYMMFFRKDARQLKQKVILEKRPIHFSIKHKYQLGILVAFVVAWAFEGIHGIHPVVLAFISVIIMMYPRYKVLSWETIKTEVNWGTFFIVGTGLTIANLIHHYEINTFIVSRLPLAYVNGPAYVKLALVLVFCSISRIAFAGTLGYLAVMLPLMMSLAIELNLNPLVVGMLVSYIGASVIILPTCTILSALIVFNYRKLEFNLIRNFGLLFTLISIGWYVVVAVLVWPLMGINLTGW